MRPTPLYTPFRSIVRWWLIALLTMVFGAYMLFQSRYLISGPQITLSSEPPLVTNERTISLSGQTFNISRLWLNDRPIFTDETGHFTEAIVLENGYTRATLRAEDRYGRSVQINRSFVYAPVSFIP